MGKGQKGSLWPQDCPGWRAEPFRGDIEEGADEVQRAPRVPAQ